MGETEIGKVFDYFSKIGVAAINLTGSLKIGDRIHIRGATTDFEQEVESMQVNGKDLEEAESGDEIGIKVADRVRKNDAVFLLE